MQKVKSTAIGILGMHRSGTSVTARVVNLLGAYIGEEEEMIRPDENNPAGYYEHQPINTLHNRILEALGRSWDTAIPLPPDWHRSTDIARFRDELIEIVESRFAMRPLWAWKDPRTSILLPLWKDILAELKIELHCLLVYRNPLDVARSLRARDGFSKEESLGLWLNHNIAMLQNSAALPRALVSYQELLTDPIENLKRWAHRFPLHWSPADKEVVDAIRQTVRRDLCHSTSTLRDLTDAGCPTPVGELARLLESMAKTIDFENPAYQTKFSRLVETHASFTGLYSHDFIRAMQKNSDLRSKLNTDSAKLDQIQAQLQTQEKILARAQATVKDQAAQVEEQGTIVKNATEHAMYLEYRHAESQSQLRLKDQQITETHHALRQKEAALGASRSQQQQYEAQFSEARDKIEIQKSQIAELQSQLMSTEGQLAGLQARFDRITSTYSWRITRPLRALLDVLIAIRWKVHTFWYLRSTRKSSGKRLPINIDSASISGNISAKRGGEAPPAISASHLTQVPKLIAFYLPQFHPIPENDEWWGKGFTDWTNVSRARALFKGHHQPRRPTELGYYDLRVAEVREAQAKLARAHGIHGFCYYYYWFDGRRLLERPLDHLLESGIPDFPFCLCWANESWSRRWDGSENQILIAQKYSDGFAEKFAEDVAPYLLDPRYIRVGGRPLLIVYRMDQIPDPERVVNIWRQVFRDRGVGEVILGAVEAFSISDPTRFGFDVAIEFPPHRPPSDEHMVATDRLRETIQDLNPNFGGLLRDYRDCARSRSALKPLGYPVFRGVMPSWDNSARRDLYSMIYLHASPQAYQNWLTVVLKSAKEFSAPHEPVVFINAWNEWAEAAYLEPDTIYGDAYLKATKAAVDSVRINGDTASERGKGDGVQESPVSSVVMPWSKDPPEVTVIIPAFNQVKLTWECLNSLYSHKAVCTFEVVLVDDGSSDETPTLAQEMPWVRVIRREQNGGFGSACNLGVEKARGQYLVFLNNDTTVCEGWLDALHETFEHWPRAGLVGSKLVHLDGNMQECGSLVFRDGSAANYGRGGNPQEPRYCFARETDYVSGAAMMIRTDLFRQLGGFDPRYEPAYYEDTDLAFRVREKGLQVVVNPHAMVRHHEGGTAGMDTSKGIKRYQVINQEKFFKRWKGVLAHYPVRPSGEPGLHLNGPRVLVVDWIIPRPDRDSGSLRMAGILRALRRLGCYVTLASRDLSCEKSIELPLERVGVEVLRSPYIESLDRYLIEEGRTFDYVIVSRRDTANLIFDSIERHCTNAKLIYDTCDLHFVREGREAAIVNGGGHQKNLDTMRALELAFVARSDITLVVSPEEQGVLHRILPHHDVRILSNIVESQPTPRPFAERSGLIFIGFFRFSPNVDGVLWFVREVLPELARRGLEPAFHVVGSDPPPELQKLESEQIKIHGYVPDVEPLFNISRLSVAPLRFGAGVKGKITQSMALGVPCVTTSLGAEGMFMENGVSGMVADEASDFASAIAAVYQSEELWSKLREGGLQNTDKYFSPEVAQAVLADLIFQPAPSSSR